METSSTHLQPMNNMLPMKTGEKLVLLIKFKKAECTAGLPYGMIFCIHFRSMDEASNLKLNSSHNTSTSV